LRSSLTQYFCHGIYFIFYSSNCILPFSNTQTRLRARLAQVTAQTTELRSNGAGSAPTSSAPATITTTGTATATVATKAAVAAPVPAATVAISAKPIITVVAAKPVTVVAAAAAASTPSFGDDNPFGDDAAFGSSANRWVFRLSALQLNWFVSCSQIYEMEIRPVFSKCAFWIDLESILPKSSSYFIGFENIPCFVVQRLCVWR
jgi:hypothetical protein